MDDLIVRIEEFNKNRLPEMRPIKYTLMAKDVFHFFRGTNHLYFEDLGGHPFFQGQPVTWICGDAHIENFGSYKADNKHEYFDVNDFDEAMLAPFGFDIVRLVTSILIACKVGDESKHTAHALAERCLDAYIKTIRHGKPKHAKKETASGVLKHFLQKVSLRTRKNLIACHCVKGTLALHFDTIKQKELSVALKQMLTGAIQRRMDRGDDERFAHHVIDVGFRITGTGSLGQKRYVALCDNAKNKPILLDIKESLIPSGVPYMTTSQPSWHDQAERIIWAETTMQDTPPALLSNFYEGKNRYVLKSLQPSEDKINYTLLLDNTAGLKTLAKDFGVLLASSHLRGCGKKGACTREELREAVEEEAFREDILKLAQQYKKTMMGYYAIFKKNIVI